MLVSVQRCRDPGIFESCFEMCHLMCIGLSEVLLLPFNATARRWKSRVEENNMENLV